MLNIPPRIYFLPARKNSFVVIFRRGPSKWTQLIKWNTETDEFTQGQWFKGRIYERRSDISSDGNYLIYFAAKFNRYTETDLEYTYAWTAISKPPYYTALALWPKGDCWHGGGLFLPNNTILLNHKPEISKHHPNHSPEIFTIIPNPNATGEDDPIFSKRLERDGWNLIQEWDKSYKGYKLFFQTKKPEIRQKNNPITNESITIQRSLNILSYKEIFSYIDNEGCSYIINDASWVDWDISGRLILAKQGKIFASTTINRKLDNLVELLDTTEFKPSNIKPTPEALSW